VHAGQDPFPETIGRVTKAITFNSPHGGVDLYPDSAWGCAGCTQAAELYTGSDFMAELSSPSGGLNPQPDLLTKGLTTAWTVIGSECDIVVRTLLPPSGVFSAIDMNAQYAVVYARDGRNKKTTTCYDHGGVLKDQSTNQDAQYYYCSSSDPDNKPCGVDYKNKKLEGDEWQKTENGLRGLPLLYSAIRGCVGRSKIDVSTSLKSDFLPLCTESPALPGGEERASRSHRLWMLSTTAAAWALLRR